MLTDRQKLELIAELAGEGEFDYYFKNKKLANTFGLIYTIAHPHKECKHDQWEKEAEDLYNKICK